mgnify:FL=1
MSEAIDEPFVKVRFALEPDEGGWPPVNSEGLWALKVAEHLYKIDNVPWFVRNLAACDVVVARPDQEGVLWFEEKHQWGGHLTLRVVLHGAIDVAESLRLFIDLLKPYGVSVEGIVQYGMAAVDVPPGVPLAALKALLVEGEKDGRWSFEEGLINEEWLLTL